MYVYLISNYSHTNIQSGYCEDVRKAIGFYSKHNDMTLNYPLDKYLHRLVYLEEVSSEGKAVDRLTYFTHMPNTEKIKLIESINPDWIELKPGVNIEL